MKLVIRKIFSSLILGLALFALNACSSTSGSYCSMIVENEAPESEENSVKSKSASKEKEREETKPKSEAKPKADKKSKK